MDDFELPWLIIDKYFNDNKNILVKHHLDTYNAFYTEGIQQIMKDNNPIKIIKNQVPNTDKFLLNCNLYLGGKNGNKIYFGKPMIHDDNREHYMFPNEARLRNMTYAMTIHYDIDVEYTIIQENGEELNRNITLEKIFLGRFPIMLSSKFCVFNGLDKNVRFEMGECKNEYGGYFIVDGKEKVIISQEKFSDNMMYVRDNVNEIYSHSVDIRSVSEDPSKPVRTLSIRIVTPSTSLSNNQIVVNLPNVRKPVPLFILMRALGILSDKEIIEYCVFDIDENEKYVELFIPSIHDAGMIFNQQLAIKYISTLTKGKSIASANIILSDYLLPHIGELNYNDKAYFIGHMVKNLLSVYLKENKPTDRDSFKYKRVEPSGTLLYNLFKEYYSIQKTNIFKKIDKEFYYKKGFYQNNFYSLIEGNVNTIFSDRIVEEGFRKAFKGNWGSTTHTKKLGIVQDLNRLSWNSAMSQLRKINLPLDASAKVIGPRLLHSSQWGVIDPVDTPDGGNIGLHKHMSICCKITTGYSLKSIFNWLRQNNMIYLSEVTPNIINKNTKIFLNGAWVGIIKEPIQLINLFKEYRRLSLIPIYTSINWEIKDKLINIFTDAGRLCRPIFYIDDNKLSYDNNKIIDILKSNNYNWNNLISGFNKKKNILLNNDTCYLKPSELYDTDNINILNKDRAIIDFIDTSESETALIAFKSDSILNNRYTHMEIHPSLIFGIMGNQVVFPENNQLPRDLFACGQARQAVSLYHSNYQSRIDKTALILNNGQIPLVKSRYFKYLHNEEHPYGENVIVAIMSYNGYNVEDSILFNEASVNRGLFRTTYFNMYETRETSSEISKGTTDTIIDNIQDNNVIRIKPGYDYSKLSSKGLVKENTYVDDKTVLIGKINKNIETPDIFTDASVFPKKGQLGYVDKSFITDDNEGSRIAKVRIRNQRIPTMGDKFCSRCGQKGTIGMLVPEKDMPFNADGIRPDIIINPHAIPSRMTIGQLLESLMGKASSIYGGYSDCTAFNNEGPKNKFYGELLNKVGYHSSGTELLYDGYTGEQIESEIYLGPTYYMRLKHMVKDKINYRSQGPRTMLTRQTVQGRANDGGLRIGEMDRDCLIAHGITKFLEESMMVRGDEYYMAVCNNTGTIAIYNESKNLFISPNSDGPIKFDGLLDNNMNIVNVTRYGKNFSIIRIPYAFKLLLQELKTMNIQMRIITDDNVNQLINMNNDNNDIKLSFDNIQKYNTENNIENKPIENKPIEDSTQKNIKQTSYIDPNNYGWYLRPFDIEINNDVWGSIIINADGKESDVWYFEDNDDTTPDTYVNGWIVRDTYYNNGTKIPDELIIEYLKNNRVPDNWNIVTELLKKTEINLDDDQLGSNEEKKYEASSPDYIIDTPPLSGIKINEDLDITDDILEI